ncbi:MAG: hypothetical protein ACRD8O_22615 [Bryobacteraceae bacterium]
MLLAVVYPLAILLIAVTVCYGAHRAARRALRRSEDRFHKRLESMEEEWEGRLKKLESQYRDVAEQSKLLVAPEPLKSGLNLSKRSQALQMSRRGESPDQISATLGIPRNELDLLLRVHRIVVTNLAGS